MRLLILFMLAVNITFAQDSLVVTEIHDAISRGYKPGYSTHIPDVNYIDIVSQWKKQIRSDSKGEFIEMKNEIVFSKIVISNICSDSITVYSKIVDSGPALTGTNMSVFIMASDSSFIDSASAPAIDGSIKSYIRSFAVTQYRNTVIKELSAAQKKLDVMNEELRRLQRNSKNSTKKINSYINKSADLKEKIAANEEFLEAKTGEIEKQKVTVKNISESDQKIDEEKKLKQLEKEKSKLIDEGESLRKSMDKNNSYMEDVQKKSELNDETNIPAKTEEIENQKEVVSTLSGKLNSIK